METGTAFITTGTHPSGTQPSSSSSSSSSNSNPNGNHVNAIEMALATLQPLRDLSRNWDVDIASCLEEYLQELAGLSLGVDQLESSSNSGGGGASAAAAADEVTGNKDGNGTGVPNFAHAALILQNSSHVYGRKVEYLHTLVYKALHEFFQSASANHSSNNHGGQTARRKSVDPDIEEFYDFDPHENFLLLDDVIPEDETLLKINLKDDNDSDHDGTDSVGGGKSSPLGDSMVQNKSYVSRLSSGGLSVTGRSRLERPSLGGGGGNRGSGGGGLGSAQHQRALWGMLNNGNLRLVDGHCDVAEDGVLLMPGSQSGNTDGSTSVFHGLATTNDDDGGRRSLFGGEGTGGGNGDNLGAAEWDKNIPIYDGDHSDDNDGPGFVMNDDYNDDDDNVNANLRTTQEVENAPQAAMMSQKRVTFNDPSTNRPTKEKKKIDLWELMDPHSIPDASYVPKPLRKGKTYRLPKGILRPPSECVTGARTSHISHPQRRTMTFPTARPSLAVEAFRVALGKQLPPMSPIPWNGSAFGDEFMYIAKENARIKRSKTRAERKEHQDIAKGYDSSLRTGSRPTEPEYGSGMKEDLDDDEGGGFGFGGEDDEYDEDYGGIDGAGKVSLGNSGLETFDDVFNRPRDESTSESNMGKTFEELCRAHIEAFAKGAEKFALNTKLTERVSKWQARLAPILEEEEKKAAFDIHYYSEVLLESSLEKLQRTKRKSDGSKQSVLVPVDFGSVTQGCTQSDVCRFFLASLSLANSGNLEIEERSDRYQFKVLSDDVKKPMETYRAPSLASN